MSAKNYSDLQKYFVDPEWSLHQFVHLACGVYPFLPSKIEGKCNLLQAVCKRCKRYFWKNSLRGRCSCSWREGVQSRGPSWSSCVQLLCLFGVSKCGDDSMAPCVTWQPWQLCISVLDELKVHKFRTQKEMLYEKKPPICNGLRGEFSKTSIQFESIRDFLAWINYCQVPWAPQPQLYLLAQTKPINEMPSSHISSMIKSTRIFENLKQLRYCSYPTCPVDCEMTDWTVSSLGGDVEEQQYAPVAILILGCYNVNTPLLLRKYSLAAPLIFSIKPCKDWALCSVTCGGKSDRSRMVGKLRNRRSQLCKPTVQGIFQSLTPISWHGVLLG